MKVLTYNVHKGMGRRRTPILDAILDSVHERDPDVFACQEVFHPADGEPNQ